MHGQGKDKYDNVRVGLNSRLDTLQAVVLLNKLKIFDEELILRQKIADYYSDTLSNYLTVPDIKKSNNSAWAQYSVLTKSCQERSALIEYLNRKSIPTAIYYKKLFSDLDIYKSSNQLSFRISKKISDSIFSLPIHPYLTQEELEKITNTIINFYK